MRVGTIGTGFITTWFLDCWLQFEGNKCEAVYSRNFNTGKELAEKYNVEKIYTSLEDFFVDPLIDVVYIASVNSLHYDHALMALNAGKHVILEKPFTSTIDECRHLMEVAKKNNLVLFEGITNCYLPHMKVIKETLQQIEPIRVIECNMSQISRKYHQFKQGELPNVFNPEFSGGALGDLNSYNIHFVTELFNMPKKFTYYANIVKGIDISGCVLMQYDGFVASCIAAKDSNCDNRIVIQGEKGTITVLSSAAVLKNVEVKIDSEIQTYDLQSEHELTHYYYIEQFLRIIKEKDFEYAIKRLNHTFDVMKILQGARDDARIVFKADR